MGVKRVNVNLMLDDDVLYENLIQPYKTAKELKTLFFTLLNSYYYDERVRNLVDAGLPNGVESEQNQEALDIIQSLRNTIAVQNFLTEELDGVVTEGSETILDTVNNIGKKTGVMYEGEDGLVVKRIESKAGLQTDDNKLERLIAQMQGLEQKVNSIVETASTREDTEYQEIIARLEKKIDSMEERMQSGYSEAMVMSEKVELNDETERQIGEVAVESHDIGDDDEITFMDIEDEKPTKSSGTASLEFLLGSAGL